MEPGSDTPRSALSTPRSLLSTPRSLLSVSRSILSTPRSLLSASRARREAQSAARHELYLALCNSVRRDDLQRLSRGQLKERLLELGAAPTEGDGLLFGGLVDIVLFWNAMERAHNDSDPEGQEEALLAIRDGNLPAPLLDRTLLVIGVSADERKRLSRRSAAELLYNRLLASREERAAPLRAAAEAADEAVSNDHTANDAEQDPPPPPPPTKARLNSVAHSMANEIQKKRRKNIVENSSNAK